MQRLSSGVLAALILALVAGALQAGSITFSGDTTGQPTWNRTTSGEPPTSLSGVGTAVPYQTWPFTVSAGGTYVLEIIAAVYGDSFLSLYQTSFDPTSQFTNALSADDDSGVDLLSRIDYGLLVGTQYYMVVSGFDNDDFGTYTANISGPGDISLTGVVPEPGTWLLLGAGMMGLWLLRRR